MNIFYLTCNTFSSNDSFVLGL